VVDAQGSLGLVATGASRDQQEAGAGRQQTPAVSRQGGLTEQHVVTWRNRSWTATASISVPDGGADGVLFNLGGHGGGWSFYLKAGVPMFCYNLFGIEQSYV